MATLNMSPVKFKLLDQCSPRRSERKRSLFPTNSPQAKDGMGGVSPLNSSPDIYSPPLPSPSWSITPTKEDTNENHYLSPRSRIKFDNLLKKKGQLEFHSLSPEPLLTKSPHKSRKDLSERNFVKVFEKLPDSPEKQDPNNLPSTSKYEVVGDNYNNLNKRVMKTPKKGENIDLLKRRSPKSSSEKKLEIKPRTFYGNIAPILATNQTNCIQGVKRVFGPPLMISKARTKLFNDKNEGDSKKRSRSKSSESVHRSKKRKEMYPGVRHAIKRPKSKHEDHHVALVKYDSIRDKIKKSFDFSHTPYAVKKKRNDGWDYPARFTKPERIEGDENLKRKFFKSTVLRESPLSVVRNGSLLTPPPSIKKRKLLDPSCAYFEDSQSQEQKDNLNGINPSDILDMIEDGLVQDVECLEEQKGVSEILLHLAEDEEEEEDSLDRTRRELVELFDEDSCTDFREKSKSSPGESVSRLADSTAILAINENARDFIPSYVQKKNTKENLDSPQRFFPIFSSATTPSPTLTDVTNKKVLKEKNHWRPLLENQMQIDAGQRQFGATQCSECGLVYQLGEPDDEIQHNLYHSNFQTLRHVGWKNENVVGYFGSDRIIMVAPTDLRSWQFKAESVLQIVDKDLGFTSDRPLSAINFKAFLYVSDKTIVGCLVAVPLTEAYKMYVSETDVDICSKETYPVKCGISRIWTHSLSRRQGIATKLVDTLRRNFMYGCILSKEDIAYSVPSPDGKRFAQKYMGKTDYYVYCNF